jgi:electron transport complex protein RnfB
MAQVASASPGTMVTAEDIDALLPQTQCTRCGYGGCRPYADALLAGEAQINQCPPGGAAIIGALAELLQRPALPLNPANGVAGALLVAQIDEEACIGCARCLPPCPVDAIVGTHQQMHTVVVALCTGCELCVAPCPVDCIAMVPRASLADTPPAPTPHDNRERFSAHNARITGHARQRAALLAARKQAD